MVSLVSHFLAALVLIAQVALGAGVFYYLFRRNRPHDRLLDFLRHHGLVLAFCMAVIAMLGSLFFSEIAGYEPCKLCWFQRIAMYPLVPVLGLALIRRDRTAAASGLSLAVPGVLVSIYHNYIYYSGTVLAVCSAAGGSDSCVKRYTMAYGYISIPMMALTAFLLVIIFLSFDYRNQKIKII